MVGFDTGFGDRSSLGGEEGGSALVAVFADVHGNLPALEAVLEDIRHHPVTSVVCLGDVANMGPAPRETIRRIRGIPLPTRFVLGNTDAYLLQPRTLDDVAHPTADTPAFLEVEAWCAERLSDDDRAFLQGFEPSVRLRPAGLEVLAYHGSPRSYDDPIRATTPDQELEGYFEGEPAALYVGAHTHEQFARRYRGAIVANPGSVGLPLATRADGAVTHPAVAEYALVEVRDGQANLTLRRVRYRLGTLLDVVAASGMPHATWWTEGFFEPTG